MKFVYILPCIVALLQNTWFAESFSESKCNSCNPSRFQFSLINYRNRTGHWIAEVRLNHKDTRSGPWRVDIDQNVVECEEEQSVSVAATVTAPNCEDTGVSPGPPPGYKHITGLGYYKFHTDAKNWLDSRRACEEDGAHLAVINSEVEAKAILPLWITLYSDWRKDWALIGNWDPHGHGQFLTIFNETLDYAGYNKWSPGEPDYPGQQNYGLIRDNGLLGNGYNDTVLPFFCEY